MRTMAIYKPCLQHAYSGRYGALLSVHSGFISYLISLVQPLSLLYSYIMFFSVARPRQLFYTLLLFFSPLVYAKDESLCEYHCLIHTLYPTVVKHVHSHVVRNLLCACRVSPNSTVRCCIHCQECFDCLQHLRSQCGESFPH